MPDQFCFTALGAIELLLNAVLSLEMNPSNLAGTGCKKGCNQTEFCIKNKSSHCLKLGAVITGLLNN